MLEQIRATLLEEYSVSQWVLLFFLYSFCGWCWEVFLYLVKERRFVNRGFLFGPILPIYGFGAVGILLTCVPVEGNMALVALVGTIAASLLEYVTGFLMETIFHVRYWDYSERPLNVNGYICALSAATWAVFSVSVIGQLGAYFGRLLPLFSHAAAYPLDFLKYGKTYGVFLVLGLVCSTSLPAYVYRRLKGTWAGAVILAVLFWLCLFCLSKGMNDPFMYFRF